MIVDFGVWLLKVVFLFAGLGVWYTVGKYIDDFIPGLGTFFFVFIPILIGGCIYNKGKISFMINVVCSALMAIAFILFIFWSADII